MKKAFSLVELLIVAAVIGILAAMAMPLFQDHVSNAREAAAKENLRILRSIIELYAAQHKDAPPGYSNSDISGTPSTINAMFQIIYATNELGQYAQPGTAGYDYGPYLKKLPENPYNGDSTIFVIPNALYEINAAIGTLGWIYKPATKEIRLNRDGTDSEGIRYLDY